MSQQTTKILRIFQKHSQRVGEKIRFKTAHITKGGRITLLGVGICLISLIVPWISIQDNALSYGESIVPSSLSFSPLLGGVGFFILGTLAIILFSIFSIQKKEKLRFISLIQLSDQVSAFFGSLLVFILSLHSFFLIIGLNFFSREISYKNGIILCLMGSIIIFIGSHIMKKEYRKNIKGSYVSNLDSSSERLIPQEQKNNMKFPF